jgi:hypothetical protein
MKKSLFLMISLMFLAQFVYADVHILYPANNAVIHSDSVKFVWTRDPGYKGNYRINIATDTGSLYGLKNLIGTIDQLSGIVPNGDTTITKHNMYSWTGYYDPYPRTYFWQVGSSTVIRCFTIVPPVTSIKPVLVNEVQYTLQNIKYCDLQGRSIKINGVSMIYVQRINRTFLIKSLINH